MGVKCPKCQHENPDTVKFCGECGTPLEVDVVHTKNIETPIEELITGSTFARCDGCTSPVMKLINLCLGYFEIVIDEA